MNFIPDILETMLQNNCGLCGKIRIHQTHFCTNCIELVSDLIEVPTKEVLLKNGLKINYFFDYEDSYREWIVHVKKSLNNNAIGFFSDLLALYLKKQQNGIPIAWVPAHPLKRLHFVEKIVLELERNGTPIAHSTGIKMKTIPQQRSQKYNNSIERKKTDNYEINRTLTNTPSQVILFDDVCTTGSTLLSNKKIMESSGIIKVIHAVVLAYTPKYL